MMDDNPHANMGRGTGKVPTYNSSPSDEATFCGFSISVASVPQPPILAICMKLFGLCSGSCKLEVNGGVDGVDV